MSGKRQFLGTTKPVRFGHAHVEVPLSRHRALHLAVGHSTPYDCFWPRPYWVTGITRGDLSRGIRLAFVALHVCKRKRARLEADASAWWGP